MPNKFCVECLICATTHEHADVSDALCFTRFLLQLMSIRVSKLISFLSVSFLI